MRVALVCEKPSFAAEISSALLHLHPDIEPDGLRMAIGNPIETLDWSFDIPGVEPDRDHFRYLRHVAWRNYPIIAEPLYKPVRIGPGELIRPCISLVPPSRSPRPTQTTDTAGVLSAFRQADLVVVAMDASPPSVQAGERILRAVLPEGADGKRVVFPWVTDMSRSKLIAAVRDARPWEEVRDAQISSSRIKRHFTYNYAINALGLLGRAMEEAVASSSGSKSRGDEAVKAARLVVSSRNALQLLYRMREDRAPASEGETIIMMERWAGTGRYPARRFHSIFGSCTSRHQILANLVHAGLVDQRRVDGRHCVAITELGLRYLDLLHPDCHDRDQGFRLETWREMPEAEARPKVERYVRTFFGKQKRFLGKVSRWRSDTATPDF